MLVFAGFAVFAHFANFHNLSYFSLFSAVFVFGTFWNFGIFVANFFDSAAVKSALADSKQANIHVHVLYVATYSKFIGG